MDVDYGGWGALGLFTAVLVPPRQAPRPSGMIAEPGADAALARLKPLSAKAAKAAAAAAAFELSLVASPTPLSAYGGAAHVGRGSMQPGVVGRGAAK